MGRAEEAVLVGRRIGARGVEVGRALAAVGDFAGAGPVLRRAADSISGWPGEAEALRLAVAAAARAGDRAGAAEAADRLVGLGGIGADAVRAHRVAASEVSVMISSFCTAVYCAS